WVAPQYYDVAYKGPGMYDNELKEARSSAKVLSDPKAALESKDANDRFMAASMLIQHYRSPRRYLQGQAKTEQISAEESKRILEALLEGDWPRTEPHRFAAPNPAQSFMQLGLTPAEGWTQPANFQDLPMAAKKWLKENLEKYRIKRVIVESGIR